MSDSRSDRHYAFRLDPKDERLCPICGATARERKNVSCDNGAWYWIDCPYCGQYEIDHMLPHNIQSERAIDRYHLSGAIRELGADVPVLSPYTYESCLALAPRENDVAEKARRLLGGIARKSRWPGDEVTLLARDAPLGYVRENKELQFLIKYLKSQGFVVEQRYPKSVQAIDAPPDIEVAGGLVVEAAGWEELAGRTPAQRQRAFVAMWFNDETAEAWSNGIQPAIEQDCFWQAERIDLEEHNDDVVDRILGDIRGSRFLVADFTGHRNGVYFEAGFALGLGIPVIWVCREDAIAGAHFDTNHFSHVIWTTPEELREKLANRIRATIGEGDYQATSESRRASPAGFHWRAASVAGGGCAGCLGT